MNQMNDQFGMQDLLEQEKYLISNYASFLPEVDEMPLRTVLTENLNGCAGDQYRVYTKMSEMGWYPTEDADVNTLNTAKQHFAQLQSQLTANY